MLFNRRYPKPSTINLPGVIATLPFDQQRTAMYPRAQAQMAAIIAQGPADDKRDVTWLPMHMAIANRWKTNQESSSVASPVQAVRQSGAMIRSTALRPTPGAQPQAATGSRLGQPQMRPQANGPMTHADLLNNMSKSMPAVGARISPAQLSRAAASTQQMQQANEKAVQTQQQWAALAAWQRGVFARGGR